MLSLASDMARPSLLALGLSALALAVASPLTGCATDEAPLDAAPSATAEEASGEDELTAVYGAKEIDYAKTTRIFLVGDSHKLGSGPLEAAVSRVLRYRQLYPNDQVVLYVTDELTSKTVKAYGASVVPADTAKMRGPQLMKALLRFGSIASIDFYGHSNPWGALLESEGADRKLNEKTPNAPLLATHFARERDPYVTLNGCNGGIFVAPALSKIWSLPVSGGLTGSDFQRLHTDGHWYGEEEYFNPGPSWVTTNELSYDTPVSCKTGACRRMKPINTAYHGAWGDFEAGLGFYKFFCAYDGAESCERGMARSLLGFPSIVNADESSSSDVHASLAIDWLCPTGKKTSTFDDCVKALPAAAAGDLVYSAFHVKADAIQCDEKSCQATLTCKKDANGEPLSKSCVLTATPVAKNTTMATEYNRFLSGFARLRTKP